MPKVKVEIEKVETPKEAKMYDVIDHRGRLINIYEDKERAMILVKKNKDWKVEVSPAGRTREDVKEEAIKIKAERLQDLRGRFPEGTPAPIARSGLVD